MRLFVHIGTHKTATTSVQAFLRDRSAELAEAGIYVPVAGTIGPRSGHHNIGWALRGDRRFKPEAGGVDELVAELLQSSPATAVISAEGLSFLVDRHDLLRRFHRTLTEAGIEPHYLAFHRKPLSYAPSLYATLRSNGLRTSFRRFAREVAENGKFVMNGDRPFYFEKEALAARWKEATGADLHLVSYEQSIAGDGVLPTFLSAIGAPRSVIAESQDAKVLNRRQRIHVMPWDEALGFRALRRRFPMLLPLPFVEALLTSGSTPAESVSTAASLWL